MSYEFELLKAQHDHERDEKRFDENLMSSTSVPEVDLDMTSDSPSFTFTGNNLNEFKQWMFMSSDFSDQIYFVPKALVFMSIYPYFPLYAMIQAELIENA